MPKRVEITFGSKYGIELFVRTIRLAEDSIRIAAYGFSSRPITEALIEAQARTGNVEIVCDPFAVVYGHVQECMNCGIEVYVDKRHSIFHNKYIIADGVRVHTGSMNFSKNAERNAENTVYLVDHVIGDSYTNDWGVHRDHSTRLTISNVEYQTRLARSFLANRQRQFGGEPM